MICVVPDCDIAIGGGWSYRNRRAGLIAIGGDITIAINEGRLIAIGKRSGDGIYAISQSARTCHISGVVVMGLMRYCNR